jgi:hypothetical protein
LLRLLPIGYAMQQDTAGHVNCISPIKPPCIPCMHHLRNVTDDLTSNLLSTLAAVLCSLHSGCLHVSFCLVPRLALVACAYIAPWSYSYLTSDRVLCNGSSRDRKAFVPVLRVSHVKPSCPWNSSCPSREYDVGP